MSESGNGKKRGQDEILRQSRERAKNEEQRESACVRELAWRADKNPGKGGIDWGEV